MSKNNRSRNLSASELAQITSNSKHLSNKITINFDAALDVLINRCIKRGLEDVTLTYYKNELKVFRYYLTDYNEAALENIKYITHKDVEQYVQYMREVRNSQTGNINTKIKALKTFLRVNDMNHVAEHCIQLPDELNKVEAFTTEEVNKLLKSCDLKTFIGLRDYTIMLVFADTGIRVKELCNLRVTDIDLQNNSLLIRKTKNKHRRYAPVSKEILTMVTGLIKLNYGEEYIFQSLAGNQLSRTAVQRRVNLAGKKANLNPNTRCSPHTFRNYFAKTMVENGVNVFELQKLLGHSSLEMVRVYVNLYDKQIYKAHQQYSPSGNIFGTR